MSVEILIRADRVQEELSTWGPILFADDQQQHHLSHPHSHPHQQQRRLHCSSSSLPHLINEVDIDDEDEHMWKKSRVNLMSNLFILGVACMSVQTALLVNSTSANKPALINYYYVAHNSGPLLTNWTVFVCEKFIKFFDCLILPQYLIKKLGCKSTIFFSFLSYIFFYMTTKFYPFTYASYLGVFLNERVFSFLFFK